MIQTRSLREVASIYSGGTPSKFNAAFWKGDIPWVSPKDMGADEIRDAEDHISDLAVAGSATNVVPARSILTVVRSGILVHRFPIALTTRPVAFNQDIKAIVVDQNQCLPEYVFWCLRSQERDVLSRGVKKGATVHSLSSGFLENMAVPLLPIEEQRNIVDALDCANALRRLRGQAQAKVREIVPSLFVAMFGDPAANPKRWELSSLGAEIAGFEGGHSPKAGDSPSSPFRILKLSAVTGGVFRGDESKPAPDGYEPSATQFVRQGDLLITRSNTADLVGAVAPVRHPVHGLLLPDLIWRVVLAPQGRVNSDFLFAFLQSAAARRAISALATGTSDSMRKLSQARLRTLFLLVPPIELQLRFSKRLAEIEGIAALSDRADTTAEQLSRSLLSRVFRFDGTTQSRNLASAAQ